MDVVGKLQRARIMAAVRSQHTRSTERRMRAALVAAGMRGWRCQAVNVPGKPDFVFPGKGLAVFVDGCFWHGCPKCYRRPHSSRRYWDAKLAGNIVRDRRNRARLRREGWRVIRIWEHELTKGTHRSVERIKRVLRTSYDFQKVKTTR